VSVALGLTTRQVAERLVISPKTADHHIEHLYTKIGVSTRGAAALWAIEQNLVRSRFAGARAEVSGLRWNAIEVLPL
jgi:Bacterial regulatory proteins, luxR family